ncbi:hypothetical protein TNCT_572381 [Trichonephila clavata]|uniref:Uncharacterized protein n=1 Tax=Trichonephila clavata TaxID=2740835 RepID=A0A8X6LA03_TRICU|nr:hypothetical protein TNCT_572381 [Trichonephila clavata]
MIFMLQILTRKSYQHASLVRCPSLGCFGGLCFCTVALLPWSLPRRSSIGLQPLRCCSLGLQLLRSLQPCFVLLVEEMNKDNEGIIELKTETKFWIKVNLGSRFLLKIM